MLFSSNAIFFYTIVPKDKAEDSEATTVIKSNSVSDIIFIQAMLRLDSDIIIGHSSWEIEADNIYDVQETCRSMEYHFNGEVIFNEIMKKFGVRLGLYWGMNMSVKMYRRYYKQFYDTYYSKLTHAQKADPPKAMYYNAFQKTVNEYINIEKQHGNIILTPQK